MGKGERRRLEPEHNLEGAVTPKKSSYHFSKTIVSIFAKKVEHPSGPDAYVLNAFIIPFLWMYLDESHKNGKQQQSTIKDARAGWPCASVLRKLSFCL